MSETWSLRRAREEDAEVVARHRYPAVEGEGVGVYARWVAGAISRGAYLGWVAEVGGEVIAGAGLTLLEWGPTRADPNPVRARVANVFTEPDWRGRGVAKSLLARCLAEADARNIRVLTLSAAPEVRPLYEKLGFVVSKTEMTRGK